MQSDLALPDDLIVANLFRGPQGYREQLAEVIERVGAVAQTDCPVTHHWAPHIYMRELLIPKGTVIVGKIHRTEHIAIMLRGDMTFLTPEGPRRMTGSFVMPRAAPLQQRAAYAHEDTVFLNVHATDKTDLAEIERDVVANDLADAGVVDVATFVRDMLQIKG